MKSLVTFDSVKYKNNVVVLGQKNPVGGDSGFSAKVVVTGSGGDSVFTPSVKRPNLDSSFGVHRYPQGSWVGVRFLIDLSYLLKDGIGFWNFF